MRRLRNLDVTLTRRQAQAWAHLSDPRVRAVTYGGAKGGGKSHFLCTWAYTRAWEIAARYKLARSAMPLHVGWIGRKRATDFVATTLQTWQRTIPSHAYQLKAATEKHPRHILIDGRVAIDYGGLDSVEAINKFNSAEYAFIACDQAEETKRDDVAVLMGSLRLMIEGEAQDYKCLWPCNPAPGWIKEEFIDHPTPERRFVPALYHDNPHLPESYVGILEDAFGYRPDLLRAYRDGDWSSLSAIDQCILQEWITAAQTRLVREPFIRRLVTVDPARFGNDVTVILCLENTRIVDAVILPYCSTTDIAMQAQAMSIRWAGCPIVVEEVGLGAGVVDALVSSGAHVISYNPAGASSNPEKWYNLRAEVWSTVGRWFCMGVWDARAGELVCLPDPDDDPELLQVQREVCRQLVWPTYKFRGAKTLIAPKEDIKADHEGVSPDYADAYVQGVWHLPLVEPVVFHDRTSPVAVREKKRRSGDYLHDRMGF